MKTPTTRSQCQKLWARYKYQVLSHSNQLYLTIRNYLKEDEVSLEQVQSYIDQALALPENPGQVVNAFQHVWGYFKKKATQTEKEDFIYLLDSYAAGKVSQADLIVAVRVLLVKYPNPYLQASTLIAGGEE